jgi:uncharacterized protein YukE
VTADEKKAFDASMQQSNQAMQGVNEAVRKTSGG